MSSIKVEVVQIQDVRPHENADKLEIGTASSGESLVGGTHGREGIVIKPVVERIDSKVGRVVLKYISDAYLFGNKEQDTTDI